MKMILLLIMIIDKEHQIIVKRKKITDDVIGIIEKYPTKEYQKVFDKKGFSCT